MKVEFILLGLTKWFRLDTQTQPNPDPTSWIRLVFKTIMSLEFRTQ